MSERPQGYEDDEWADKKQLLKSRRISFGGILIALLVLIGGGGALGFYLWPF